MSNSLEEAKKDAAELRSLATKALRPRVREVLDSEARRLESYLDGWGSELAKTTAAHVHEVKKQQALFEQTVQSVREMERGGAEVQTAPNPQPSPKGPLSGSAAQERSQTQPVSAPLPIPIPMPRASADESLAFRKEFRDFDAIQFIEDKYGSSEVTVFVVLEGIGEFKERVQVKFTIDQVDILLEGGPRGLNYRRRISPLFKDVLPNKCTFKVLRNKIKLTLVKEKETAGPDLWTELTAKKPRTEADRAKKHDPTSSIMGIMEDMYENADEKTRAIIGEAMYKSRTGVGLSDKMEERKKKSTARSSTGASASSTAGSLGSWQNRDDDSDGYESLSSEDEDELLKM